jgi:hypothetical protein
MAAPTISTHGVMEGGGSYNLHAKIPAANGSSKHFAAPVLKPQLDWSFVAYFRV